MSARASSSDRKRQAAVRGADAHQGRVSPTASYLTVRELLAAPHLGLEIFSGSQGLERSIRTHRIHRLRFGADGSLRPPEPDSLVAAGPRAVELLGRSGSARRRLLRLLADAPVPGLLVSRTRAIPEALAALSRRSTLPLLLTRDSLDASLTRLGFFLRNRLGAEITVHGVLVEVFGVGMLLLGPSGIGKSESALELVTRGHRLIADDMVIVHRGENRTLMGSGSGLARYHMEIRGIGIIDVKELYGVAAVLASAQIGLVVQLEEWKTDAHYDRLGLEDHFRRMLDIPVAHLKVPVSPGRNIAVILEVAARNHLLKKQGYHSARELNRRLMEKTAGGAA